MIEVFNHLGISVVTPSWKIGEILMGDKLTKARKKEWEERQHSIVPAASGIVDTLAGITKEEFFDVLGRVSRPQEDQPDEESSET